MQRFSVTHLLMGTALIAILLVLTQAEGCGARYSMIETISFSSDDSRILVSKLTARDAQTPGKGYKANVARTISWLNTSSGLGLGSVHQDFKPGNCGPAFHLWMEGRSSVLCNPRNDQVVFTKFGGGQLTYIAAPTNSKTAPAISYAANLAASRSGRLLAASGGDQLTVWNTSTNEITIQSRVDDMAFLGALQMAFNADESRLITVGDSGVCIWDTKTGSKSAAFPIAPGTYVNAIALMPDDSLVVSSNAWSLRYDLSGRLLNKFRMREGNVCVACHNTNTLVISDDNTLELCDATTGNVLRTLPFSGVSALALSSNDELLAIGDHDGRVALVNLSNGQRLWLTQPAGRRGWPWTIPTLALAVWCWTARRLVHRVRRPAP